MGFNGIKDIGFSCFALLAVGAVIRGFTHQGYRLKQRSLNFRPALYIEGTTAIFGVVSLYIMTSAAPCLEVVCGCLMIQAAVHSALSHIMADTRYEAEIYVEQLRSMLSFGLPLLLSGAVMFWSMQGERLVLSAVMTATEFAHFSMLFQLALVPILVLSRMALTLGLPALASVKENRVLFQAKLDKFHQYIYLVAGAAALLFVIGANVALMTLFGPDFKAEIGLVFLLAIAQALRLCRAPQSIAAQALGQTDIPLKANIVRIVFVIGGIAVVLNGGSLTSLLTFACIGEGATWVAQAWLFSFRNREGGPANAMPLNVKGALQ